MPPDFTATFVSLKQPLRHSAPHLHAKTDTSAEYTLVGTSPSPFKQHKGEPMFFASVRTGKAYVSFHLLPLYMNETLSSKVSPALKKRMQGKACFNFRTPPEQDLLDELTRLTDEGFTCFRDRNWI